MCTLTPEAEGIGNRAFRRKWSGLRSSEPLEAEQEVGQQPAPHPTARNLLDWHDRLDARLPRSVRLAGLLPHCDCPAVALISFFSASLIRPRSANSRAVLATLETYAPWFFQPDGLSKG